MADAAQGKRYRLAAAAEWECAMRTRGVAVVAAHDGITVSDMPAAPLAAMGQHLSEVTAVCFDPYVPTPGRERMSWKTSRLLCEARVPNGAGENKNSTSHGQLPAAHGIALRYAKQWASVW